MNFRQGLRGYTAFPLDDSVFDLKFIPFQDAQSYSHKLSLNNYYEGDSGDIDRDLNILSQCDVDARGTNDFYNGGQLEYKMRDWIDLATEVRNLKANIRPGEITKAIVKYNDNLQRAKMEVIFRKLMNCAQKFNAARYRDPEASYTRKTWSGYYNSAGYPIYNYEDVEIPYQIDLTNLYDPQSQIIVLAKRIEQMENKSGYRFMDPRDWQAKLRGNGRTDTVVKQL